VCCSHTGHFRVKVLATDQRPGRRAGDMVSGGENVQTFWGVRRMIMLIYTYDRLRPSLWQLRWNDLIHASIDDKLSLTLHWTLYANRLFPEYRVLMRDALVEHCNPGEHTT
jgi:hypothetical protein